MPAAAPAIAPRAGLPVSVVAAAAAKAPKSMNPSSPMLSTTRRSTRSSPRAASRIGVASAMPAARKLSSSIATSRRRAGHPPAQDASVEHGDREKRRALYGENEDRRDARRALHRACAGRERRE